MKVEGLDENRLNKGVTARRSGAKGSTVAPSNPRINGNRTSTAAATDQAAERYEWITNSGEVEIRETPEEAAARTGTTEAQMLLATALYDKCGDEISIIRGKVVLQDLITACDGDPSGWLQGLAGTKKAPISPQKWLDFLGKKHAKMRRRQRGSGDKWLNLMFQTMSANLTTVDVDDEGIQETDEEAASRTGMTSEQIVHIRKVYSSLAELSAADHGCVTKETFVEAQRANMGIFDKIDRNEKGYVNQTVT